MREAKARLSELADRASAGETIIVTRHGKPVMQLSRPQTPRQPIDLDRLRKLTDALPRQSADAAAVVRRLREEARY